MNDAIAAEVANRGITRLCHFTPMRNLVHIATGDGLASTTALAERERAAYTPQDLKRLDGYPDHICCSIEYPNAWYFRRRVAEARGEDRLFQDWVVLGIDPACLAADQTLFCPRNAAAKNGRLVGAGLETFRELFAETVQGAGGRTIDRGAKSCSCPTDDQAEALVRRHVPLEAINPIVVRNLSQAKRTYVALEGTQAAVDRFDFVIAPAFFDPAALSGILRAGELPVESAWDPATLDVT